MNLLELPEVQRLLAQIGDYKPSLVIFDTLATCSTGADENSSKDMGRIVASCNTIRATLGCTVLLVHHSTKSGETERGHGCLSGAADVMIRCAGRDLTLTMSWTKNKDLSEYADIKVSLKPVSVLCGKTALVIAANTEATPELTAMRTLQTLVTVAGDIGTTGREWQSAACTSHDYSQSTFYRHRKELIEAEFVVPSGEFFIPTERGLTALPKGSRDDSHAA